MRKGIVLDALSKHTFFVFCSIFTPLSHHRNGLKSSDRLRYECSREAILSLAEVVIDKFHAARASSPSSSKKVLLDLLEALMPPFTVAESNNGQSRVSVAVNPIKILSDFAKVDCLSNILDEYNHVSSIVLVLFKFELLK